MADWCRILNHLETKVRYAAAGTSPAAVALRAVSPHPGGWFRRLGWVCSDEFSPWYSDLMTGSYDCVDRIVLNAFFPVGHNPAGFAPGGGAGTTTGKCVTSSSWSVKKSRARYAHLGKDVELGPTVRPDRNSLANRPPGELCIQGREPGFWIRHPQGSHRNRWLTRHYTACGGRDAGTFSRRPGHRNGADDHVPRRPARTRRSTCGPCRQSRARLPRSDLLPALLPRTRGPPSG
jgi:hypothetical protein